MRNVIRYNASNPATSIVRGTKPSARHIVMGGEDKVTSKQCRKTRKGAARLLEQDDERRARGLTLMFNDDQRAGLEARANGGSSKLYNPDKEQRAKQENVLKQRAGETEDQHVARLRDLVLSGEIAKFI